MQVDLGVVGKSLGAVERSWTERDSLLYALGVGAGSLDPAGFELEFTTENSIEVQQRVLPTFATIIGGGGSSREELSWVDPTQMVHGEQSVDLLDEIPPSGTVVTESTIAGIYDKGSGALVVLESRSNDARTGTPLFSQRSALFVRGAGGFGGDRGPGSPGPMPDREADQVVVYSTRPDQALLYRLSGDRNPLHSDPVFAKRAGFDRPILHGLCTFGFTGRALLHTLCGSDPARMRAISGRFSKPTYPGDTLTISMWVEGQDVRFRTQNQRGETVIDSGTATVA
ncbi:MAG TPA: MaoC/PaaZ C-terminal domain-containing protein [Acidimicrobiales bacterium]|nr:MaoC/PaaZ C-terminal domain-containing protein [Acidimicrobiales bacterium]